MEVVGHEVDEVQVLGHIGDIVGQTSGFLSGTDSGTEDQTVFVEFLPQFLQQSNVVGDIGLHAAPLVRVLPVDVETVEAMLLHEGDDVLDELATDLRIGYHVGVLGRALVPATDGDHRLGLGADLAELVEAAETVLAPVIGEVLPAVEYADIAALGDADECVDQMGAEGWVDVVDGELAIAGTVDRPAAEVTDDFFCGKEVEVVSEVFFI